MELATDSLFPEDPAPPLLGIEVSVPEGILLQELSTITGALVDLYGEISKSTEGAEVADLQVSKYRKGSLVIELSPHPKKDTSHSAVNRVTRTLSTGLAEMVAGNNPDTFTPSAIKHANKLAGRGTTENGGVIVTIAKKSISCDIISQPAAESRVADVNKSWGSVEGYLQMVTVRDKHRFNLYEVLSDDRIECVFDPSILDDVKESLDHRIVVYGIIHTREDVIKQVTVERIHRRPDSKDLPGFAEIRGIFAED